MPTALILGATRPESLETSYRRAFSKLGWQAASWDPQVAVRNAIRGGKAGRLFSNFVHVEPWVRKASVDLLQRVETIRPELMVVIATSGIRAGTLAQAQVLSPKTRVYMVYPDSPHGLNTDRIACLPVCHRVAVSSPAWAPAFKQLGARHVEYLPFAADTELYARPAQPPSTSSAKKRLQLGFVGTWRREREALLEQLSAFDMRIWGGKYWSSRTDKHGTVRANWAGHELIGQDMVRACGETAIMLNILDPITWPGPNMRSFELPACGAFVLSQRSPAIAEIFRESVDIECFDSAEEARDKAAFYLSNESARSRIARSGYERVTQGGHTYLDRARTLAQWADLDA